MNLDILQRLPNFLEILGLDENPIGMFYRDTAPEQGYTPVPMDTPTHVREKRNEIDWRDIFSRFSCVMGHIWRARRKQTTAYFSARQFGCPGGAFWLGFMKPQTEAIIHYVSTGVPSQMEGEYYCSSPDTLREIFAAIDPPAASAEYCIFKPLHLFEADQTPVLVHFFARPETICGLHQLATFVTDNPEVVASPWSAACGSLAAWPLCYLAKGQKRAVIGGWDPSARKYFKTDELSFTVPFNLFLEMITHYEDSFLKTKTWENVRKKITRSKKAWNEA